LERILSLLIPTSTTTSTTSSATTPIADLKRRKSIFAIRDEQEAKERVIRMEEEARQRARQIHMTLVGNAVSMQFGGKGLAV
jgi:hypothetical protein